MKKSALSRRGFLQVGASVSGGLLLGFYLPGGSRLSAQTTANAAPQDARLNAWIHIAPDDTITFMIHKSEMGQGTVTSLSQLLADELDCEWGKFRTEFPPVDPAFGPQQGVVGSQSIRTSWVPLRRAGATARQMLITAAAQTWGVDPSQCRAQNGVVTNTATGASLSYGKLAAAAAKLPVPQNVTPKDPSQYKYIGKPLKRLDTAGKVNGTTQFGIDARLPGLVYAAVARCPVVGGKVATFDDKRARAFPGVQQIVPISSGVAVVASNTWSAVQASRQLDIQWDLGPNAAVNTTAYMKTFADKTLKPGAVCNSVGNAEAALKTAAKRLDAVYQAPFLAHAPMEPLNCTADVRSDACHIYASTQMQTTVLATAVQITGLKPEQVHVHSMFMGGGFGRRATGDFIADAVEISKAVGKPVKATWSREDDITHDRFRPASLARFSGGLDADGWPVAWLNRAACPSIMKSAAGMDPRGGIDRTSSEGLDDLEYNLPNLQVEYHWTEVGIPTHFWRAVGYTQNTFFAESFLDELAAAGKKDPVELRRRLLAKSPRLLNVLNLAAEKSGWGQPLPEGRHRGVATVFNVGTFSAQVAEVSVTNGKVRVHRVVAAVDCGHVVNPMIVQQQIRSAIVYGLSAALKGEITVDKGRIQQTNFHQYDVIRIDEMPVTIDVYLVPSNENPGGIGEAGVPAIAPAVANAVFSATGKRVRQLPIRPEYLA
jgi:isoquinoline 1-oxidoreductase beta subunit